MEHIFKIYPTVKTGFFLLFDENGNDFKKMATILGESEHYFITRIFEDGDIIGIHKSRFIYWTTGTQLKLFE